MKNHKLNTLNDNEKKVYRLIEEDPFISQQDIANEMELSRPSVANLISGLVKKGFLLGKAYVVNKGNQIICIGGANVDRKFYVKDKLQLGTSNPIRSEQSAGGVARNIAENLGRLGLETTLLTASGDDSEWAFIESASSLHMNLDHVPKFLDESTGSYTALLDEHGDLTVALADMDVYERITPEFMLKKSTLLSHASCIIADLNCPKDTLQFLCQFAKNHRIPLGFVTVSAPKMKRMPDDISGLTWLVTNIAETEAYFNEKITTKEQWELAVENWLDVGVKNVVITNGKNGSIIGNNIEGTQFVPAIKPQYITDVTGAGDAFSAAVFYAWLNEKGLEEIGKTGAMNATKTLQSSFTVRQDLSKEQLQQDLEEL